MNALDKEFLFLMEIVRLLDIDASKGHSVPIEAEAMYRGEDVLFHIELDDGRCYDAIHETHLVKYIDGRYKLSEGEIHPFLEPDVDGAVAVMLEEGLENYLSIDGKHHKLDNWHLFRVEEYK